MTRAATTIEVDRFWSSWLGCRPEDLARPGVRVVSCSESGSRQIVLFRRDPTCIVSVADPAGGELICEVENLVRGRSVAAIFTHEFWRERLGGRLRHSIGPAYTGCADESNFQPCDLHDARLLASRDLDGLRRLADACSETDWEHGDIRFDRPPVFACIEKDGVVAAASYEVWGARTAHIGVVTHPARRGRGFGKSVVAAAGRCALAKGLILQYRTLAANAPSVAIARSLGFQRHADTLSIRLGTDP